MYCIDASVLVNSFIKDEEFHEHSRRFLAKIKKGNLFVALPEIVLPEVASAIARITGNRDLAMEFANNLREVPNFVFIPVDKFLAMLSAEFAAAHKLRGCDAIYVAVASHFKLKLITLDNEQLNKAKNVVGAFRPQDL